MASGYNRAYTAAGSAWYYLAETYHALDEPKRARAELDPIMSSQAQPDDGEATHLAQEAPAGWFDDY